jgi:hypothetical protein
MVSSIKDMWPDDGLIEKRPKHVVNFKLHLAINNTCTSCVSLLYLLIVHKLYSSYKYDILILYSQIVTVCLLQIMINKNQTSTHTIK